MLVFCDCKALNRLKIKGFMSVDWRIFLYTVSGTLIDSNMIPDPVFSQAEILSHMFFLVEGTGLMTHFQSVPSTGDGIVILTNSQRRWHLISHAITDWGECDRENYHVIFLHLKLKLSGRSFKVEFLNLKKKGT